ncbi:hypothetical protein [Candidatus Mycoplasma haematobovis]|uniref:hypothetical protein n=1 Tax=Candidatus Mycoplasma haematobovis TaxID=432608 RepID=UPI000AD2C033|nr:hypothetical protein [Candidatus Mycoplasma haematobovis]
MQQAFSFAPTPIFEVGFDHYVSMFIQMNNVVSDMNKVIKNVKINDAVVKERKKVSKKS